MISIKNNNMVKKINIAIDGYSSCGKSTIAKSLAEILHYIYIDTGAMYRAITYFALKEKIIFNGHIHVEKLIQSLPDIFISFEFNENTKNADVILNGVNIEKEIRTMEVAQMVSKISEIKEVREKLVSLQQKIAEQKGVVMDGRDIGSVVLPDAEIKLFMTADQKVRTKRRYKELLEKGINVSEVEVYNNILERDTNDVNRKESPLIQTDDAVILDNTYLTIEEQLEFVVNLVNKAVTH
jgi:CMP/dCMP kinase